MDQNFYNETETTREDLPTYGFEGQAPVFEQEYTVENTSNPELEQCVNGAFGKALAAVIAANFPIASVVSIILGVMALKGVKKADALAEECGVSAGGKRTAAKIMGMIGTIYGGVMTGFYALYFLIYGAYGCIMIMALLSEM